MDRVNFDWWFNLFKSEEIVEVLFYIGMLIFGFYCLVTEPIEKVEKDFGIIGARNKDVEIRLEDQS